MLFLPYCDWVLLYKLANQMCVRHRTMHFLSTNLIGFAGHVVLFWSWLPQRRWTAALVDSEMQRKICEILGIST